jgi:ATP-dependent RNA helicase DeaD
VISSFSRPETDLQIKKLIQTAGFRQPTPLQKAAIPLSILPKDLIVEANGCRGKAVAIITSAILKTPLSKNGLHTLILTGSRPDMQKLFTTAVRISSKKRKLPQISCIGLDDNIGRELRQLHKQPSIIIGSSERLIDHIRRGNINLEEVKNVLINYPADTDIGFDKDILYIYSKLPKRHSTALYCARQPEDPDILKLLKKPNILNADSVQSSEVETEVYTVEDEKAKTGALAKIILANHVSGGIILTGNRTVFTELKRILSKNGSYKLVSAFGRNFGVQNPENVFIVTDKPDDLNGRYESEYIFITEIKRFQNVYSSQIQAADSPTRLIIIHTPQEAEHIKSLEEKYKVKKNKKQDPGKADLISEKLRSIVKKIRSEEDPDVMDWYKRLIKKNVPIHLRSYIGAYLLKESGGFAPSFQSSRKGRASSGKSEKTKTDRSDKSDKDFATLFISIGKNRRVFPRDLSGMLCNTLEMGNENIGSIKVLDNYSFVDITHDFAQKAIDSLDGSDFRGRKITVNFARKKG